MNKKLILSLAIIAVVSLILIFLLIGLQPDKKTEIVIGYQPSTHHAALMVAAEKGWWEDDLKQFGIESIEFKKFASGPPEMEALQYGKIDAAYTGSAPVVSHLYEGMDAKIVAAVQIQGSGLVVRSELAENYTGPESLRGMVIATYPPGSIQYTILTKWLSDNGLNLNKDVIIKDMGPAEAVSALIYGHIDAVFLPSPHPEIAEKQGAGKVVEWSGDMWPGHACCCLAVSEELIKNDSEIVEQIVKTHIRATEYVKDHPEEVAGIIAKWIGTDEDVVLQSIRESDMEWIYDPYKQVESVEKYAEVIYNLNRDRYERRGYSLLKEHDIFDFRFYDNMTR
ncbi:MAG: ABC transporter substrate-binding protein [Candidatus Methanoliparum thermophilum]|uniref:ABC transporter substrate-binding protein n=2 Tax=Candidatus Methanoliparum TaxID=2545692 RepID=A0A520KR55_METT2|nr:MAG: ABC transporter substrate-binding protein [Candidatus Methanoliparum thermophilum]BDC35640.1 sulfonate ABC transporter substrate-binding protein [Candidatus Methanoliparum sp. LAM-1]